MKWTPGYRSENVEDRRGEGGGGGGGSLGGIGMLVWLFKLFGLPGLLVGGAIMFFGSGLLSSGGSTAPTTDTRGAATQAGGDGSDFVGFVLDDVQKTWASAVCRRKISAIQTPSWCCSTAARARAAAPAQAEMGPFYCPLDQKVYIDLSFYDELKQRFGAPGDFAQAYVIAHEVGHHVQHLLGLTARSRRPPRGEQTGADARRCGSSCKQIASRGMGAHLRDSASCSSRATSTRRSTRPRRSATTGCSSSPPARVTPETWTHGSSAQRERWFKRGYEQRHHRVLRHLRRVALQTRATSWRTSRRRLPLDQSLELGEAAFQVAAHALHRGRRTT